MVSKNMLMSIKIIILVNYLIFEVFFKVKESLVTLVIIYVNAILNR